ncbi:hypothetical protein P9272_29640 [Mesorhizobium sp. WSM4976]|uniref:hypothetical protein n=1 Tax=Mesorhizobium sp. WSM4976 TaxID=3038549 RepID=UPI002416DF74|nr:hypothetical protein [Mesorhizobium sp. WSM4976]MDG4897705.1 hypothetical protein [Mesorhizobium sp. WSM4976]
MAALPQHRDPDSHDLPCDCVSFAQATNGIVEYCNLACDNHTERLSDESPLIAERAADVISKAPQEAH